MFDSGTRVGSRASDAIALAPHVGAPMHADDSLLDQADVTAVEFEDIDPASATL